MEVTFQELRRDLEAKGIDASVPGFEDSPPFLAAYSLDDYAEFVLNRPYSPEYLAFAKAEVEALSRFVFEKIRDFGRLGACLDASELIQRMLERRGVWCFAERGGVTVHYKSDANLPDGYYWPWSLNEEIVSGHGWVVAPPYRIIDTTIRLEPYFNGEEKLLPEMVLEERPTPGEVEAVDIMMGDEFWTLTGRELTLEAINRHDPTLLPSIRRWGVMVTDYPGCTIKYVPVEVAVSLYSLEEMEDNIECGTLPKDLLQEYEASRDEKDFLTTQKIA